MTNRNDFLCLRGNPPHMEIRGLRHIVHFPVNAHGVQVLEPIIVYDHFNRVKSGAECIRRVMETGNARIPVRKDVKTENHQCPMIICHPGKERWVAINYPCMIASASHFGQYYPFPAKALMVDFHDQDWFLRGVIDKW